MKNPAFSFNRYLLLSIMTLCFFGTGLLSFIGYEMGSNASSNFTKIHPLSYLLLTISVINLVQIQSKESINRGFEINKLEYQLLSFIIFVFIYLYFTNNASSVSFIVDTLLCPILLGLNFRHCQEKLKWQARKFGLQLILLNSYIAIGERIFAFNIFPINTSYGEVFRSTALLGHPLNNALITLVFILYASTIAIPVKRKIYTMAVLFTALICFGARGSLYVSVLSLLLLFIIPVFTSNRPYFKKINKLYVLVLIGLMIGTLISLTLSTSLGERLAKVSFYDSSSGVRVQALELIDFNNLTGYLFAKNQNKIDNLSYYAEVEIIENFFIIWILKFGLIVTILLLIFLYQLFYTRIPIKSIVNKHIIVSLLLIAAATNNSLATNTQTLTLFVALFGLCRPRFRCAIQPRDKNKMVKSYA